MPVEPVPYQRFNPDYSPGDYSPRDALSLALASELAYRKNPGGSIARGAIARVAGNWGFDRVHVFEEIRGRSIDTQGYMAANDGILLAAFRGSDNIADWRANIQAVTDPGVLPGTQVHEGFQDAFQAGALAIGRLIERAWTHDQAIWITGHSLGGALAVLLAASLMQANIPVAGLYTFGAPRVGNKRFEKIFNRDFPGASYRVANTGDIVPHLPPEPFFSHTGKRVIFRADGSRTSSRSAWKEVKQTTWGWMGGVIGDRRLVIREAHRLNSETGYLQRLLNDLP
jgi:triacylglycerol lipase